MTARALASNLEPLLMPLGWLKRFWHVWSKSTKTLSWPPPCWPQPCLSSLKPFGLWGAFVNTSDAIWCGETPGLILPRPFREHLWQRLKSCSVLSSFCSLKYQTGAPRLLRRSTPIHIYADSCARQNEYFHICMHKITLKVYTLQSETFSLSEVGIIRRHLKNQHLLLLAPQCVF